MNAMTDEYPWEVCVQSAVEHYDGYSDFYATKADAMSTAWSRLQELSEYYNGLVATVYCRGQVVACIPQSDLL